jgi:two-component system, cell cycle response regulator DivK
MLDGTSILYVEDNPDNQILIMRILAAEGYHVSFAANGTEALEQLKAHDYDLLLLDINLPDIDGYTLTDIIRQQERFKDIPILALTANVMKGDKERSLNAGCDGYIQKPVDVDDLPSQIEYHLKR